MVKKIMIVDDTRDTVELVEKLLKSEGYTTIIAFNGKEALDKLRSVKDDERPDLILLDMFMPGMSGREVCKTIRADKDPGLKDIKIAFFTVANFKEQGKQILNDLKVIDYITKPFDVDDLLNRVRTMLEQ
jgi:CheY-like chemotaxis protein